MNLLRRTIDHSAGRIGWIRIMSLALVLGFGAFIVGCSTMSDVRAEEPAPDPALFGIEITSAPESVTAGDEIQVRYRVRNTGELTGTHDVRFSMDGRNLTSRTNLRLEEDQSRTGTFRYTSGNDDIGNRMFRVASQDAQDSVRVRVESKPLVLSSDVLFDYDSSELRSDSVEELDRVANSMNENPDARIRIEGHTDNAGTQEYNQRLSERRAQAVADYLANRNVPRNRMIVEGKGELEPTSTNQTSEGRQQNRRVEIYTF